MQTVTAQIKVSDEGTIKIDKTSGIPLVGLLHIGVIDRGSNLLQVRTSTACNMSCTFCSTDAGPYAKIKKKNIVVDPDYLLDWVNEVIALKECDNIEINLDSMGEPSAYPYLIEFIERMKEIPEVHFVSMQTNGTLLTPEKIDALAKAGLHRINLSVHGLSEELAKYLFGSHRYDVNKIKASIQYIRTNTAIEVNLTPVYLPGVNDAEIPKLIQLAKETGCRISIQKYELYKYSRKERDAERISWYHFYKQLETWEKEFGMKLKIGPHDFNVKRAKKIPLVFRKGEIIYAEIRGTGWLPDESIAVAKDRSITVLDHQGNIGDKVKLKIISAENSIYLAKKI